MRKLKTIKSRYDLYSRGVKVMLICINWPGVITSHGLRLKCKVLSLGPLQSKTTKFIILLLLPTKQLSWEATIHYAAQCIGKIDQICVTLLFFVNIWVYLGCDVTPQLLLAVQDRVIQCVSVGRGLWIAFAEDLTGELVKLLFVAANQGIRLNA